MKLALIVTVLLLLGNPAIADGIDARGKEIKGYVATSGRHVVMFGLSGSLAAATYGYMNEKPEEKAGSCSGTIKQFPGVLCAKKERGAFECLIRVDLEKGVLDGNVDELCEHHGAITRKAPIEATSIYVGEEGMAFDLIGNSAKTIYNQMPMKPIYEKIPTVGWCLGGGSLKWFEGLECVKAKNRYLCYVRISSLTKKMEFIGDACPEE
ncbi:MAG: hypothetical protein LBP58_10220 [Azoarcus sp.]|jgi:hypothetical protein|nr:hypothetical protein [Azoarcus sp.]